MKAHRRFERACVPEGQEQTGPSEGLVFRRLRGYSEQAVVGKTRTCCGVDMTLSEQITQDLTTAMKARDELRLSTLRMVKSALKNREIEFRRPLEEAETQQVLSTLIKQREDAMTQFLAGGRPELASKEKAEKEIIEAYLPKAATPEAVEATVRAVIAETGASSVKDMGAVMKAAMARFQAAGQRVDGKLVSETVKRLLGA